MSFQVRDEIGMPDVVDFVQRQLLGFDMSNVEWFKLLPLDGKHPYRGMCQYPEMDEDDPKQMVRGYRIRCSVNILDRHWPLEVDEPIGSWRSKNGKRWGYEYETVVYTDKAEAAVCVAGHEAFHFLRHSRQVPGRNTEPSANRFGLDWLARFRGERASAAQESQGQLELFPRSA